MTFLSKLYYYVHIWFIPFRKYVYVYTYLHICKSTEYSAPKILLPNVCWRPVEHYPADEKASKESDDIM